MDAPRQLGLFGTGGGPAAEDRVRPHVTAEDEALADALPGWIRFGTSSWSFPGWAKLVYAPTPRPYPHEALARDGLAAYASHPLLRTVGLDRSYYGPVTADELGRYATQVRSVATPERPAFRLVSKVWEEITTAVFPKHPRYGARANTRNPFFLDAGRFVEHVLAAYRDVSDITGPFVFELTPMPSGAMTDRELSRRIETFVAALPRGFAWAFELRNRELFGPRWVDTLRAHRVAHVFNYWTAMPSLAEQMTTVGRLGAPFAVARLMLPPFTRYAAKKAEFAPFDALVSPQPTMRDDVVRLLLRAADQGAKAVFVVVNNKAEGSAPLTIRALAQQWVRTNR